MAVSLALCSVLSRYQSGATAAVATMNGAATTIERIDLVSSDALARSAFFEHFFQSEQVKLRKDFENLDDLDCLVVPCSNGFGLKEGVAKDVQRYALSLILLM